MLIYPIVLQYLHTNQNYQPQTLFAEVAYNEEYNENANFRTFSMAFYTLLGFTTGENWGQFMYVE